MEGLLRDADSNRGEPRISCLFNLRTEPLIATVPETRVRYVATNGRVSVSSDMILWIRDHQLADEWDLLTNYMRGIVWDKR
jgi:hypothetical protein